MWCRVIAAPSQNGAKMNKKWDRDTERQKDRQKDRKTDNWKMENEGVEMFEKLLGWYESGLKTGFLTDREIF